MALGCDGTLSSLAPWNLIDFCLRMSSRRSKADLLDGRSRYLSQLVDWLVS